MKEKIILLLGLLSGVSWATSFIAFIRENGTELLSEVAGTYTVCSLIAELEIRSQSAQHSNIKTMGMTALQTNLSHMDRADVVKNYIFKGKEKTGIVYLDNKLGKVLGVILICTK